MVPKGAAGGDADMGATALKRIDLHCHSRFSANTDDWMAGFLGVQESYTDPETVYRNAKARGMTHVTLTDRDTIEGALRLRHHEDFVMGEEVTAFFPSEALHVDVLVWGLEEAQHERIQELRYDLFALVEYLRGQGLPYGIAHPGSFQTGGLRAEHFEVLLLLFPLWEARDGHADPETNQLVEEMIVRSPESLDRLAEKHGRRPAGALRGFGGSDDRSGWDVGTTYTEILFDGGLSAALLHGKTRARGEQGSTQKTAHTAVSLFAGTAGAGGRVASWGIRRAQRSPLLWELLRLPIGRRVIGGALSLAAYGGRQLGVAGSWRAEALKEIGTLLAHADTLSPARHRLLAEAVETTWRHAVVTGLQTLRDQTETRGPRLDEGIRHLAQAQVLVAPYLSAAAYRARQRRHAERLGRLLRSADLLVDLPSEKGPRVAMFTDTFSEVNGVATVLQTMVAHAADRHWPFTLIDCGPRNSAPARETFEPVETLSWKLYSEFPMHILPLLRVLDWCETRRLDLVHAATPGPVGLSALLVARALDLPLVATYHTDLPRLGYFLTRDHSVEELLWTYVRWFYGQCRLVFCPSRLIREDLLDHGVHTQFAPFDQGIDGGLFSPAHRDEELHDRLAAGDKAVVLWVGRI